MKTLLLAAATLHMLIGCAISPLEMEQVGNLTERKTSSAPAIAAECMARNAENSSGSIQTRVRAAPPAVEVLIYAGETGLVATAKAAPQASGSSLMVRTSPYMTSPASFVTNLTKGC